MLKELQFVRGSVGRSKIDAALSHFQIRDGFVKGFNGTIAICSPIPVDLDCQPDATKLIKAVGQCKAAVDLSMTPSGKLSLKAGAFKVIIDCYNETMPDIEPEGEVHEVNGAALLDAMKKLVEFIGDDASRQWTNGICFSGKSAFATNNIILVEAWVGSLFPYAANIPEPAVRELLRINEVPTHISMSENSMTFFYDEGRWLRTQLYSADWPDVTHLITAEGLQWTQLPAGFWDAIESVQDFQDKQGRVFLHEGYVRTSMEEDEGASVKVTGVPNSIFNINMLKLIQEQARKIDFTTVPGRGYFQGERIRGVINGMRG